MQTNFSDLNLAEPLLRALAAEQYSTPTPIQAKSIPPMLSGRDVLGLAQTGTGKTAAFALPILQRLMNPTGPVGREPRVLVLTPTRELAIQVHDSFRTYGRFLKLRTTAVYGGVSTKHQIDALARGTDIVVATPGRLLDLCTQNAVRFGRLSVLVLDEADRMLDMGFLPDVKRIIARLPKERQTLLFSATMPESIARFADSILTKPVRVEAAPPATTVELIKQYVIHAAGAEKPAVLADLLRDPTVSRALVFARTKHGANRITERLARSDIRAEAIHGNKSQGARQKALGDFRSGHVRVLVATDIAARGIDVDGISHVINFDIPNEAETYVHRIGRTARAGASGTAISLCDGSERSFLADIEKLTRLRLQVIAHPRATPGLAQAKPAPRPASQSRQPQNRQPGRKQRGWSHPASRRRAAAGGSNHSARAAT